MSSNTCGFRAALIQTMGSDGVERGSALFYSPSTVLSEVCGYNGVQTSFICQLQECFTVLVAFHVTCTGTQMRVRAGNWLFAGVWLSFHRATAELWQCQGCHTAALLWGWQCTQGPKAHCATDVELSCFPKTTPSSFQNIISRLLGHGVQ